MDIGMRGIAPSLEGKFKVRMGGGEERTGEEMK
jgi:hypothetical protein